MVKQARLEGERAAAGEALRRRSVGHRRARELRLGAQQAVLEEARARAREAALGLRADPRYPELVARLRRSAVEQLGSEAELEIDPPSVGGVIAHAGSVRVDYTLPALAERALEALGGELEHLWS